MASALDLAQLQAHAYGTVRGKTTDKVIPSGWSRVTNAEIHRLERNADSGYDAAVYRNASNHEVVVVHVGTEELKDAVAAAAIASGFVPAQYTDAQELVDAVREIFPSERIIQTGHSLGGALVQLDMAKRLDGGERNMLGFTTAAPGVRPLLGEIGVVYDNPSRTFSFDSFITNVTLPGDPIGTF